jgi:cytoskeletal protein CcmA (bactofilin family)
MLFNKRAQGEPMGDLSCINAPLTGEARATERAPTRSVIDAWLVINGDLDSDGEIEIDGQIHGDVRCAHLTVGRHAQVAGSITAAEVVVRGKVTGIIRAHRVILLDTAQVDGEIVNKTLSIEAGASFEGGSHHREDPISADFASAALRGNGTYPASEMVA